MPQKKLRYSQYLNAIGRHHRQIQLQRGGQYGAGDADGGGPLAPCRYPPAGHALCFRALCRPGPGVLPLALMLVGFQALALRSVAG